MTKVHTQLSFEGTNQEIKKQMLDALKDMGVDVYIPVSSGGTISSETRSPSPMFQGMYPQPQPQHQYPFQGGHMPPQGMYPQQPHKWREPQSPMNQSGSMKLQPQPQPQHQYPFQGGHMPPQGMVLVVNLPEEYDPSDTVGVLRLDGLHNDGGYTFSTEQTVDGELQTELYFSNGPEKDGLFLWAKN
jgi:hypothetical protein